jgi:hypothetical protein
MEMDKRAGRMSRLASSRGACVLRGLGVESRQSLEATAKIPTRGRRHHENSSEDDYFHALFRGPRCASQARTITYPVSCERVWKAVEVVAAGKEYTSSMLDDKRYKAELVTGHGNWTGKRSLYITLTGSGDTCEVAIEGVFSGLAHNDKGDLFKRHEDSMQLEDSKKDNK